VVFDIGIFFENLSRISSLNKIGQELRVLYMKAKAHLSCWIIITTRNVSDKSSSRENQNTIFMASNFFSKIVPFMR